MYSVSGCFGFPRKALNEHSHALRAFARREIPLLGAGWQRISTVLGTGEIRVLGRKNRRVG